MPPDGHRAGFPQLIVRTFRDLAVLLRAEARGAEQELEGFAMTKVTGIAGLAVAGALAFLAVAFLALGAAAALALALPAWAAALIVGGVLLLVAGLGGAMALRRARQPFTLPAELKERLQEDAEWLASNLSS